MADTKISVYWDEPLESTLTCLAAGWATFDELEQAVDVRRQSRPMIGKLALTYRKLTMAHVFQILKEQATSNEMFGEIAVRLGFISTSDCSSRPRWRHNYAMCWSTWASLRRTKPGVFMNARWSGFGCGTNSKKKRSPHRLANRMT
jgi:hypothetical protein